MAFVFPASLTIHVVMRNNYCIEITRRPHSFWPNFPPQSVLMLVWMVQAMCIRPRYFILGWESQLMGKWAWMPFSFRDPPSSLREKANAAFFNPHEWVYKAAQFLMHELKLFSENGFPGFDIIKSREIYVVISRFSWDAFYCESPIFYPTLRLLVVAWDEK